MYLAACIIIKNEAEYIKEWIDFHLLVGFDKIILYDNESNDNLKQKLENYIKENLGPKAILNDTISTLKALSRYGPHLPFLVERNLHPPKRKRLRPGENWENEISFCVKTLIFKLERTNSNSAFLLSRD